MTILERLKERRLELKSDLKDKKVKEVVGKEMWKELCLITEHRIAELDYIIILLKEEGIIKSK